MQSDSPRRIRGSVYPKPHMQTSKASKAHPSPTFTGFMEAAVIAAMTQMSLLPPPPPPLPPPPASSPSMRPSLSTEVWASRIPRALLPPLYSLSSLELYYCAWLSEAHFQDIIDGCPNLATFKFTSEASPTTGRPLPSSSGFDFLGPALVLKALRPRSETLTAISIRYMPLLDLLFRTRGSMDTDKNLIQTLGDFPNLRVLQISHGALGWKDIDGPKNNSWSD